VYSFARRLAGEGPDADDLLQETYARALEAWRDLRDPGRARAWLFTIARRAFLNRRRRLALERRFTVLEGGEPPEPGALPPQIDPGDVARALASLPEEMATTIALCDLWGFRYQEIAEILGCPVGTVRSRLARARTALAARLGEPRSDASARGREDTP
jgi:RNA polymerase sigma-70 factor (ECF subfamily)